MSFKSIWKQIVKTEQRRKRAVGAALGVINKEYVFDFGKYSGESAKTILKHNPSYLLWCYNNLNHLKFDPKFLEKVKVAAMKESEAHSQHSDVTRGGHWRHALPEFDHWGGDEEDMF